MFKKIATYLKDKYNNTKILDKYILKQVIELFLMGVFIFTTIIFASDTFITLIKQITKFGIPFKVAFILILLNIPSVVVMTIPMGVLLSTVMTLNRLSLSSEITVMRACGIGLNRIAKPIFIFATIMALSSFIINENVVPVMAKQSKDLALWALGQKNIPDGKENFVFKELNDKGILKYWDKGWCVSFKRKCLQPFPMNFFKMPKDPVDAKIIVFHGRPTPEQAYTGFCGKGGLRYVKPTLWLEKYWNV